MKAKLTKHKNKSLHKANSIKNDEFYTHFDDIQRELNFYKDQLKGKVIYGNCDDPAESAFTDFFKLNFDYLGIKKLICTRYQKSNLFLVADPIRQYGYRLEITAKNKNDKKPVKINLKGDGDFRSPECIEFLEEADIIITNPPFSLFREYVSQIIQHNKKFLIIGNDNAISYKEIFKLIKDNKVRLGYNKVKEFKKPDGTTQKFGNVGWFTNLDVKNRHEDLPIFRIYKGNERNYPKYDNYEAIEVSKVKEIPLDYKGAMGVPISFLNKYNPEQFEILGITDRDNNSGLKTKTYTVEDVPNPGDLNSRGAIKRGNNYKSTYARLLIKNRTHITKNISLPFSSHVHAHNSLLFS